MYFKDKAIDIKCLGNKTVEYYNTLKLLIVKQNDDVSLDWSNNSEVDNDIEMLSKDEQQHSIKRKLFVDIPGERKCSSEDDSDIETENGKWFDEESVDIDNDREIVSENGKFFDEESIDDVKVKILQ